MKKSLILLSAVAMMAMTACNEKPAKGNDEATPNKTEAVEQSKEGNQPIKVDEQVKKAEPTKDGKDHTVAEFETKDYQVKLENLADGNFRLSLWKPGADKSGKPDQVVKTKKCVMQKNNYLMKSDNGDVYVINSTPGKEGITIMNEERINLRSSNDDVR